MSISHKVSYNLYKIGILGIGFLKKLGKNSLNKSAQLAEKQTGKTPHFIIFLAKVDSTKEDSAKVNSANEDLAKVHSAKASITCFS